MLQVASGLTYLHEHKIVYYDLKSPNILVFQFPSVHDSLSATQGQGLTGSSASLPTRSSSSPGTSMAIALVWRVLIELGGHGA